MKKQPLLLQISASHRSLSYNTDLLPPFQSKLFLQVLSMALYYWQLLLRGGGWSQAQDRGEAT